MAFTSAALHTTVHFGPWVLCALQRERGPEDLFAAVSVSAHRNLKLLRASLLGSGLGWAGRTDVQRTLPGAGDSMLGAAGAGLQARSRSCMRGRRSGRGALSDARSRVAVA